MGCSNSSPVQEPAPGVAGDELANNKSGRGGNIDAFVNIDNASNPQLGNRGGVDNVVDKLKLGVPGASDSDELAAAGGSSASRRSSSFSASQISEVVSLKGNHRLDDERSINESVSTSAYSLQTTKEPSLQSTVSSHVRGCESDPALMILGQQQSILRMRRSSGTSTPSPHETSMNHLQIDVSFTRPAPSSTATPMRSHFELPSEEPSRIFNFEAEPTVPSGASQLDTESENSDTLEEDLEEEEDEDEAAAQVPEEILTHRSHLSSSRRVSGASQPPLVIPLTPPGVDPNEPLSPTTDDESKQEAMRDVFPRLALELVQQQELFHQRQTQSSYRASAPPSARDPNRRNIYLSAPRMTRHTPSVSLMSAFEPLRIFSDSEDAITGPNFVPRLPRMHPSDSEMSNSESTTSGSHSRSGSVSYRVAPEALVADPAFSSSPPECDCVIHTHPLDSSLASASSSSAAAAAMPMMMQDAELYLSPRSLANQREAAMAMAMECPACAAAMAAAAAADPRYEQPYIGWSIPPAPGARRYSI